MHVRHAPTVHTHKYLSYFCLIYSCNVCCTQVCFINICKIHVQILCSEFHSFLCFFIHYFKSIGLQYLQQNTAFYFLWQMQLKKKKHLKDISLGNSGRPSKGPKRLGLFPQQPSPRVVEQPIQQATVKYVLAQQ